MLKKLALLLAISINSTMCFATLGQNVQSINVDASNINASIQVIDRGTYQIYVLTDPNADDDTEWEIREYLDPDNDVVFGIGWNGISTNTADIILGGYLQQAEDLANNNEPQNIFKYDIRGTSEDYLGYFVLLPVTPITINPNVVR